MGIADNNEAEMAALKGLFNLLLLWDRAKPATEPRCKALIFSDSAGCIGYLVLGWKTAVNKKLARETRKLFHLARKKFHLRLYWIRGHAGIPGNEEADKLVKEAAKQNNGGTRDSLRPWALFDNGAGAPNPFLPLSSHTSSLLPSLSECLSGHPRSPPAGGGQDFFAQVDTSIKKSNNIHSLIN